MKDKQLLAPTTFMKACVATSTPLNILSIFQLREQESLKCQDSYNNRPNWDTASHLWFSSAKFKSPQGGQNLHNILQGHKTASFISLMASFVPWPHFAWDYFGPLFYFLFLTWTATEGLLATLIELARPKTNAKYSLYKYWLTVVQDHCIYTQWYRFILHWI